MKFKSHLVFVFLFAAWLALFAPRVHGQGTAFTYQGFITAQGVPANGLHDFQFFLCDAATGGNVLGGLAVEEVDVASGLFTVTLDFGSTPFNGQPRWLEITVTATNSGQSPTTLAPRHALAPTPYAILAGTVPNGSITSGKIAAGAITAANIGAGAITSGNLAPGAAAANLAAGGSAPVGGGGVILSEQSNNTNLLNTGYVKLGKLNLLEEAWATRSSPSGVSFKRAGHTATWTGSEMLIWGGGVDTGQRYNPATDSWTPFSPTGAGVPYYRHTAVWTGTELIIWDGNYLGGGRYNPASNTWATVSATPPGFEARDRHSAVWTGTEMIVWGGYIRSEYLGFYYYYFYNDGARYNPNSNTWALVSTNNAPSERSDHAAVWTGSQMIVWGGLSSTNNGGTAYYLTGLNTGGRYNPVSNTWTTLSVNGAPTARMGHCEVWTGTEMIVWGGTDLPTWYQSSPYNRALFGDGARYNPASNTWSTISSTGAPSSRAAHSTVWTGSRMIIWGGETPAAVATGGSYSPATNSWTTLPTLNAPTAREYHTAVWTGSDMIVWGGHDGVNTLFGTGARYNVTNNAWTVTSTPADQAERSEHTAVWTGSEMLIFGGDGGGFVMSNGLRYNPATDAWAAMAASGAPSVRRGHTAVWTGTEMLIWGGFNNTNSLQSGGRYNPTSNSWTAIPTNGAPTGRQNHAAVWTGSEMIIWGGQSGFIQVWAGDGGRFNPVSNTWAALSATGAPLPRTAASVVWTGQEMIVWGGYQYGGNFGLGDGARYNPGTNTWTPVSLDNAPSPRGSHTAVWTGTEMIVWGGQNYTNILGDGARYVPATNLWTPISNQSAPPARYGHTALWAGTQMIILGSSSAQQFAYSVFTHGGCYLPSEDKWVPMNYQLAPNARYRFSAVWDGTEALIYGGIADGSGAYLKDLVTYTPARSLYLYLKP